MVRKQCQVPKKVDNLDMRIVQLTPENLNESVRSAASVLREGGVIIYPTDTLYGLGGDALSDDAYEKVCIIKERDERRPIHAVFADLTMVAEYAEVNDVGRKLAAEFLPGPLTLIFNKKPHLLNGIARTLSTIGVRIPKNTFCLKLAREFGKPYTTTSANTSDTETPSTVAAIVKQLGERSAHVELAIDGGILPANVRSTVVDVRDEPFIIREGAIPVDAIMAVLP